MSSIIWTVVGFIAASLTSFSFLPQVRKMLCRRSVGDISILTIYQMIVGNSLWLSYGIGRQDIVIISANIVAISILLYGTYLYYRFREKRDVVTPVAVQNSTASMVCDTGDNNPATTAEISSAAIIASEPEKPTN